MTNEQVMWQPPEQNLTTTSIAQFCERLKSSVAQTFTSYNELYSWSVAEPQKFWSEFWEFAEIIGSKGNRVFKKQEQFSDCRWFPDASLNFAENLLRTSSEDEAIVFWGEDKIRKRLSYAELQKEVAKMSRCLKDLGVNKGDRVAAYLPNLPETIICMLATTSLGALWSSCSPDFGVSGVVDRFGQIEPVILLTADGYWHKGRSLDTLEKAKEIRAKIPSIQHTIVVPYVNASPTHNISGNVHLYNEIKEKFSDKPIDFEQFPFNHPLYIMFSSGTTGKPKCIVHGAGGTLIEHLKELKLHTNVCRDDRFFYQTTCGWMMWNWLVSGLACGATLMLYDGAPFHNDGKILLDFAEQEKFTVFGTNAKYISALENQGLTPSQSHDLSSLRAILSTGSPLIPENYDYVYKSIKEEVLLSSISGGTDIIGCFVLGCPTLPVYRGEIQCRSLGYDVQIYNEKGEPVTNEMGELVCTAPFPSQPVMFWNDPDGSKMHKAYFSHFDNVWRHGDWAMLTERGTLIISGRSDTVLNPGGVRIGTAEIYRQVETISEIEEAIVVGQKWEDDVRVILFVKLQSGSLLTDDLCKAISAKIRKEASPFHVPKKILAVKDIPRTRSGKISEVAVRKTINGEEVTNTEALANPESLQEYRDIAKTIS